jgi:hypothetical protein
MRRGEPGPGGDDRERETHSFLLQLSAPNGAIFLSRKISSVKEYERISCLQEIF